MLVILAALVAVCISINAETLAQRQPLSSFPGGTNQLPITGQVSSSVFNWRLCGELSSYILECGRFNTALDYADVTAGTASFPVIRLRADPKRRVGTLFTDQGGPGVPGTGEFGRQRALDMMNQLQGNYDIISWDPRGVNDSLPELKCFNDQESFDAFWSNSLWYQGVETNSSLQSEFDRENFYSHVNFEDSKMKAYWERCELLSADILPYVGTAAVARDIAAMADAIEGPGSDINYWGFSYGTVLGQHITALFPERLGHVILDGMLYGPKWTVYPPVKLFPSLLSDADASYRGMVKLCAEAGSGGCALSSPNATQLSVLADIDQLLLDLYDPSHSRLPVDVDFSSTIKTLLYAATYNPRKNWQGIAAYIHSIKELIDSKGTAAEPAVVAAVLGLRWALLTNLNFDRFPVNKLWSMSYYVPHFAVTCGDARDYDGTTTWDLFDTIVESRQQSKMFGTMWPTEGGWLCHHWHARAVERVIDFRVIKPKHPVLLLSNANDPITPIENSIAAMRNSFEEGDAGLGIRAGYGHCSYGMKSSCIVDIIRTYMHNWTLPPKDMEPCETEENMFPSPKDGLGQTAS